MAVCKDLISLHSLQHHVGLGEILQPQTPPRESSEDTLPPAPALPPLILRVQLGMVAVLFSAFLF